MKPDFSIQCHLCRFEIYICSPKQEDLSFWENLDWLSKELAQQFGRLPFKSLADSTQTNIRANILFTFFANPTLECNKYFNENIQVWKDKFGKENIFVLRSNVDNL
jgi:hypothetical protein